MTAEEIYRKGITIEYFNYEKGLDQLIEKDKIGDCIYLAGMKWKEFDYKKGLDALIKVKDALGILNAGKHWNEFNFEKAIKYINKRYLKKISKYWKLNSKSKIQLLSRLI